uniref:C-type lectin domain-containing protein n=1 Tax=Panagrolaimus superbus TaxID=310955 RepID=A0A914YZD0_9BILA
MLVSIPKYFIEAAQFCRSFGGNLTSIHSAFDNIFLADLAQQNFAHDFYYIGGTNLEDRKTWAWMDGSVMDFADWGNYEPIDGILNNCLVVGVGHGIWHTHDCTTRSPFVCEVPEDLSTTHSTIATTLNWNFTTGHTVPTQTVPTVPMISPTASPLTNGTTSPGKVTTKGTTKQTVPISVISTLPPSTSSPLNNIPSKDSPSSSSKFNSNARESSTPFVASGAAASSNQLLNSLLTSLAVGKAAEYFPKFDALKQSIAGKRRPQNSRLQL